MLVMFLLLGSSPRKIHHRSFSKMRGCTVRFLRSGNTVLYVYFLKCAFDGSPLFLVLVSGCRPFSFWSGSVFVKDISHPLSHFVFNPVNLLFLMK